MQVVQRECGAHRNVWVPVVVATMAVCVTTRLVPVSVLRASVEATVKKVIGSYQTLDGSRGILAYRSNLHNQSWFPDSW